MKRLGSLFLSALLLLWGCGMREDKGAAATVSELLTLCGEYPAGVLYQKGAEEGEESYLSSERFDLLFGEGSAEVYLPLVEDYALYLSSFATPFEVAFFRCYTRSDATRLGTMLLARSDALKLLLREVGAYEAYGEIYVAVVQSTAALVMSKDLPAKGKAEAVLRTAS